MKHYIGDGVYFAHDGDSVHLTAENGIQVTNRIVLEPEVIVALLRVLGEYYDRGKLCMAIGVEVDDKAAP